MIKWSCTGKDAGRHHGTQPGTGQKIKKEEVKDIKAMLQYAYCALSPLATIAFGIQMN